MFLRQIRQNGIPEIFLLPQGVEAAVQVHFVCRCKDRAAQKQLFICGIHGKVADLPGAAEYEWQAVFHLVAEVVVSCPAEQCARCILNRASMFSIESTVLETAMYIRDAI